jgi:hypothetical protein
MLLILLGKKAVTDPLTDFRRRTSAFVRRSIAWLGLRLWRLYGSEWWQSGGPKGETPPRRTISGDHEFGRLFCYGNFHG